MLLGMWPDSWREHWVIPLFRIGATYAANNYRGIHLTAQLSKVVERMVKQMVEPFLERSVAYGPNQFAYRAKRGARDALALLTLEWIAQINRRGKVALYASDVAGAFDRVDSSSILLEKLKAKGVNVQLRRLIMSWLKSRRAKVIIGGSCSDEFLLQNMVFQGTVLGPSLWNAFFEDARNAINIAKFIEIVFADDLNSYRFYNKNARNKTIRKHAEQCQANLHKL